MNYHPDDLVEGELYRFTYVGYSGRAVDVVGVFTGMEARRGLLGSILWVFLDSLPYEATRLRRKDEKHSRSPDAG